jgi:hypothetical protein
LIPSLDIFCLWEVKIIGFLLKMTLKVIRLNSCDFVSNQEIDKEGVATPISHIDPTHQLLWPMLNLGSQILGLANINVANDTEERVHF